MTFTDELSEFNARHHFHQCQVGGTTFDYLETGPEHERTIMLLNGGMNCALMWYKYLDALADDSRVIAFDYPRTLTTSDAVADGCVDLMHALGVQRAVFVGASYGGILAQVIARRHPEAVAGLALFATVGFTARTRSRLRRRYWMLPALLWYMGWCNYDRYKGWALKMTVRSCNAQSPAERQYVEDMLTEMFRDYTREKDQHITRVILDLGFVAPITPEELRDSDFQRSGRVRIILPRDDLFKAEDHRSLLELFPHAIVTRVDGGHLSSEFDVDTHVNAIRAVCQNAW